MTRVSVRLLAPILGLLAACSSTETSATSAIEICDLSQCDSTAPGAPAISADGTLASQICDDGTVAGPTCAADGKGSCGWSIVACPPADDAPPVCTCAADAPSLPSQICEDGTVAGPECVATPLGTCEWIVTECPDPQPTDCSATDCPTGQHCETDCYPCDAPDPKTPCDSFACQSTCVPD